MAASVCPPPGAALPHGGWDLASSGLLVLGSLLVMMAGSRRALGSQAWLRLAVLLATACAAAAFGSKLAGHAQAGLSPRDQAWSATVAALLGWQGLHAVVLLAMGVYLLARSWSGRLQPQARATLDNTSLMWHYVTLQGIALAALVQGLPRLLG